MLRVVLRLYGWLMWLVQPLLRRKLARRALVEPGYGQLIEERFGRYAEPARQGYVWVHAISLGETRAAAVLIAALRRRLPGMRLLLTHGTATGRAEGQRLLQAGDVQVWQPWDAPLVIDRFLRHFRPSVGLLMETEIWPTLCAACAREDVPLVLVNARLSEKSLRQSQLFSILMLPAYRALRAVYAQTEADAGRLRRLGAPVQGVFGNLKFDATPDAAQLAQGRAWRAGWLGATGRRIVLFASSREGEEAALLTGLQAMQPPDVADAPCAPYAPEAADAPGAPGATDAPAALPIQWLIVPRHPQRFDAVAALVAQQGFAVSRRSTWGGSLPACEAAATVWLGDSLGEMALYYGLADMALLGGSFEALGGQNLIEAAACGCPVVMGLHTFNFADAATLAEGAGAARRANGLPDALRIARQLAGDDAERLAAVQASTAFAEQHRGATARTADAVVALLAGAAGVVGVAEIPPTPSADQ